MGKIQKKRKENLNARIESWKMIRDKIDDKNAVHPVSGFYMRKPGSNKK